MTLKIKNHCGARATLTVLLCCAPFASAQDAGLNGREDGGLSLEGSYRLRFESLDNSFRGSGSDHLVASRLLAHLNYRGAHGFVGGELLDARAWGADTGTPLGTDDVNTLTPLQAYLGWRDSLAGGELSLRAGRITEDMGSRRLLARNRFRNTLNNFDGVSARWKSATGEGNWHGFWLMPIQRRPGEQAQLMDNRRRSDRTLDDTHFWGIQRAVSGETSRKEFYLLGLQEADQSGVATRDRDLTTAGFRLSKSVSAEEWGYELEAAWQFGHSSLSTAADAPVLDHRAGFVHADWLLPVGKEAASVLALQFDYASGDSADDGENNRFDTLYGARRFDFGPTGIYGPFARSNILSPGVRWRFRAPDIKGFVGYRAVWLAQTEDAHSTAGIRGENDERFAGHQLEARVRLPMWGEMMDSVQWELGAALLIKGSAIDQASGDASPASYLYSQASYRF